MVNLTLEQLIEDMKNCPQTKDQSVYEHGISVKNHTFELINFLKTDQISDYWKLPNWIITYKNQLLNNLLDIKIIEEYTQFHDCSKPYCRIIDENGKQHFANHAELSYKLWLELTGNLEIAILMKMDMDFHTMIEDKVEEFSNRNQAPTLLIVGLSELISNSRMFGGVNSSSFKKKFKHTEKFGNLICKKIFNDEI